ncbi:DNA adenine methylase [Candidatus Woesearchaeota archaeon]|nr:DNA adenine methylase [Candidatus Woesearchaeota archaeon]
MPKEVKITIPTFVKWAGGKGQLIEQFKPLFPKKIDRYFEPFVGSGAVFFYVKQKYKLKYSLICDQNSELITTYKIIQKDVTELVEKLKEHEKEYHKNKEKHYYDVRAAEPKNALEIAARFIFLNRTCWNGLYRVNANGKFNVPMGDYKKRAIVREEVLKKASELLKGTRIECWDFEKIGNLAKKGDFVYFDPPYYPLDGKSSFTNYQKTAFLDDEQVRLKEFFGYLTKKGVKCMLSNSDSEFITDLYKEYDIKKVMAKRMINCDATKRGAITEVVVRNY